MAKWNYAKIGDVCTVERGGSPRPIDKFITDNSNGINWIKIGDTTDSMYITETAQKITPEGMKKSRYVQPGDFLLSNSMSFGRPYILKIDGCIHDGWLVLRDHDGVFDKRFLYYYLSSPSTYQKFKNMAVGGVVNNLNSDMVRGVTVPVPKMEEQIEIVQTLDNVSNLIFLRKQQLAKLDELIKSRFIELFGDCNKQTSIKESGLTISDGNYSSKYPRREEFVETGIPFIRANNLKNGTVVDEDMYFITDEKHNILLKGHLRPNDILITTRGNIGQVAIVPEKHNDSNINAQIVLLRDENGRFVPRYLLWALQTEEVKAQYLELQTGTALKQLPVGRLEQVKIKEPEIDLQNQFAAFVEQADKSKLAVQKGLQELETLKKALMQKYFG